MTDRTPEGDAPAPRVSETRARQGFRDRPVVFVLVIGLALAVLALFGLFFARSGQLSTTNADAGMDRRDAATYSDPTQAPKSD
jgi:hypothetical protein